jgi:hypothetical protein
MAGINPIQLQKALSGADYPASRDDLVECAKGNKADDSLLESLRSLPEQTYDGPNEVSKAAADQS